MSKPTSTPHNWLQFSLGSTVFIVLLTSIILFLNLRPAHISSIRNWEGTTTVKYVGPGWPWSLYEGSVGFPTDSGFKAVTIFNDGVRRSELSLSRKDRVAGWAVNVMIWFNMVGIMLLVTERIFRKSRTPGLSAELPGQQTEQPARKPIGKITWGVYLIGLTVIVWLNARPQSSSEMNGVSQEVPVGNTFDSALGERTVRGFGWPYTALADWGPATSPRSIFIFWKYFGVDILMSVTPVVLVFLIVHGLTRRRLRTGHLPPLQ